ncbi:hypothetical protein AAG570_007199 [Ranatra chinensis]|uniref:Uncharacterized protein n=1 Tax=Ranatra chinensis TaxID=642074 RepID=A0ABD0YAE4_9HEMI
MFYENEKQETTENGRFCTSYQPDDLRPVAARAPQEPAQQDDHIYSNVAEDEDKRHVSEDDRSDEDDWCGTERSVVSVGPPQSSASSYRTKISINDRGSEISWDIVNRVFSESGYSYNQELRRDAEAQWNKKPFYKTRLHVGAQLAPYASVRDRVEEGVYAEIGDSERYTSDSNTTSSLS